MRPNLVASPATNSENGLGRICAWLGSLCFGALSPGGGYHVLNCTRVNNQSGGTSVELIAFYAPDARFRACCPRLPCSASAASTSASAEVPPPEPHAAV